MSLYPILWAVEHAPIVDAEERAILVALVSKGDFDGCNCYRGYPKLAEVARVDARTAKRKVKAMTERGLIRPQTGPKPDSWKKLPKDKRPVVREVMIPASFWSAVQLEEINEQRADRGRKPITPALRPDLPEAPPKRVRADKGVPNPKRSRKKKPVAAPEGDKRGVSESPRCECPNAGSGVTSSHLAGCLEVTSRGVSESPNSPLVPPASPSSPLVPPVDGEADGSRKEPAGREDKSSSNTDNSDGDAPPEPQTAHSNQETHTERAQMLVDRSVRLWPTEHRAPSPRDRQRLCERVVAEIEAGGDETVIVYELSRDLKDAGSAVKVIMGSRTKTPGWGQAHDPRPVHSQHEIKPRTPWCGGGACDEKTRLANVYDPRTGETRPARCRTPIQDPLTGETVACHPKASPRLPQESPDPVDEMSPEDVAAAAQASLAGAAARSGGRAAREALAKNKAEREAKEAAEAERAAAQKALAGIVNGADREKAARLSRTW